MAKKLSEVEQKAAMKALMDYRGEAQKLMKSKMKKGPKMAYTDDESMNSAMKEASDMLDHDQEDMEMEECDDEMMGDESSESEDDLNKQIEELMRRKKMMESKNMRG